LDCTLETAIDSTLPGLVTGVLASDTYGADGQVVLLERGTRLLGEVSGSVTRGQQRLRVIWQEARTPTGVVIALESPGTDALGRAGVTGEVDRHFGERFGAAMLVSVLDGAVQAAVAAQRDGNGNAVVVSPSGSQDIATEVLKDTIAIPPTIRVAPGERLQVLVAKDVDFRGVYGLERRSH
jgi:type IV secretion system protein VirB10